MTNATPFRTHDEKSCPNECFSDQTAAPIGHNAGAMLSRLLAWGDRHETYAPDCGELARLEAAHRRLELSTTRTGTRIYGIHTGYGANVSSGREAADWRQNQLDLLAYLCVGVGPALPDRVVRRALRLQAWKAARGVSGIHPQTHVDLLALADGAQLPAVPCYGSLGASGDLVPMAHAVAPIFAATPPRAPRDVLSLVNTNAMMSSLAVDCFERTRHLHSLTSTVTAAASVALGVSDEPFDPAVLGLNRLQPAVADAGRFICAERRRILRATAALQPVDGAPLQERYSIRCAPQVLGNAQESLRFSGERILAEALSVADNPLVLDTGIWHGGLFYAAGLATAADLLHDVIARCAEMVDRQVLLLVDPTTSHGLPENLEAPGALHVKGIHQLLSSLNQALRGRGVPSRQLSFSCEGNNQDIVPCGMTALLGLADSLGIAEQALRAAAFCAERAICLRSGLKVPPELQLQGWPSYESQRLGSGSGG